MCCRLARQDHTQNEYYLPQSVRSSASSSSSSSRPTSRPRDLHAVPQPPTRAPCQPPPPPHTAVHDTFCRQLQTPATRPCNSDGVQTVPRTADWNSSDHRSSSSYAYDSCIADITRQVNSFMARCNRPQRAPPTAGRNVRQNPTVVWRTVAIPRRCFESTRTPETLNHHPPYRVGKKSEPQMLYT